MWELFSMPYYEKKNVNLSTKIVICLDDILQKLIKILCSFQRR